MTPLAQRIAAASAAGAAANQAANPTPVPQPVPVVDYTAEAEAYLSMVPGMTYLGKLAGKRQVTVMDLGSWDRRRGLEGAAAIVFRELTDAKVDVFIDYNTSGTREGTDSIAIRLS